MKIAFLSTFYPFRGGIAQFNAKLLRELEKEHEVYAFTFTRQYPGLLFPGKTQYITDDDTADAIQAIPVLDSINPLTYIRTARRLRQVQPDLLVTRFWMPFFAPSLGYVAGRLQKHGVVTIAILDNVVPHEPRPGDDVLIRYFLKRQSGYMVMTQAVEQQLLVFKPDARYRLQPHPVYDHFPPPIPMAEARQKLGIPQDKKLLLFFGFIRPYKGLDLALQALSRLPDNVWMLVAGEVYGDFKPYQQLIEDYRLHHRVRLTLDYIPDPEVTVYFSAADVLVLPYRSATQSGIMQIAYHYHLPAVVTHVGGLAEMVEHGITGLVIPRSDPERLAAALQEYFAADLREPFSKNMQERKKRYSWRAFAGALLELYQELRQETVKQP